MDKNAIKKYAVWARKELISRVAQKAQQYGITETEMVDAGADSVNGRVLTAQEMQQRRALIAQINEKGYQQVMEEVAYHGSTASRHCGLWRSTAICPAMCACLRMKTMRSSPRFWPKPCIWNWISWIRTKSTP